MPDTRHSEVSPVPLFQAFSWHNPEVPPSHNKKFFEYAHDVSNGVAILLSLIEFSESEKEDERPLLCEPDKGALMRLAITASRMLANVAEKQIDSANSAYTQQ